VTVKTFIKLHIYYIYQINEVFFDEHKRLLSKTFDQIRPTPKLLNGSVDVDG